MSKACQLCTCVCVCMYVMKQMVETQEQGAPGAILYIDSNG